MQTDSVILALIYISMTMQIVGLVIAICVDPYLRKDHRAILLMIAALVFSLVIQNDVEYRLQAGDTYSTARLINSIYGYSIRPVIIALFIKIFDKSADTKLSRVRILNFITIGNALIYMSALFSNISFGFTEANTFVRGPLGYTCHFVSALMLGWLTTMTIIDCWDVRRRQTVLPLFCTFMIIAGLIADMSMSYLLPVSYLTVAIVISSVLFYMWLHLQFIREHEEALEAEQRIKIMISQIQPHFLYNTLSTIQALCMTDPAKAFSTCEKFGIYLRQNIESLNQRDLIPLSKELEHTRVYADIEQIRFPSITVEYDIQDDEFSVPALTIQPLVENAIRHGVRIREDGRIRVSTFREKDGHVIRIEDNGRGFEADKVMMLDSSHIGLRNVKERIEQLCSGTFEIDSREGEGTTITILIPSGGEDETRP